MAVSGGPDSMALLHALYALRDELGLHLAVAHLDHCLRGESSRRDAEFVTAQARRLGLALRLGRTDVRALRREVGGSIEMAARRARYDFLARVAAELEADAVAVGHTADDQVETIIIGLLRGGGLRALRGIPPERPIARGSGTRVIRPLLRVWRAELMDFLAEHGIGYRTDESNADTTFLRNWVRHELLPLLEARWGRAVRERLRRLAEDAAEWTRAGGV